MNSDTRCSPLTFMRDISGGNGGYGRRLPVTLKRMDATLQVLYDTHNALQMYVL